MARRERSRSPFCQSRTSTGSLTFSSSDLMVRLLAILILGLCFQLCFAQKVEVMTDTLATSVDSTQVMKNGKVITVESYAQRYQPRKALLYSAVFPGLGQAYNKKYWKLPIV